MRHWIKSTDVAVKGLQREVKAMRSEMQGLKDALQGLTQLSKSKSKRNIFVMGLMAPGQRRMRELTHPNYAREEDVDAEQNMENVQQMLSPFVSALTEAMKQSDGGRGGEQQRVININLISLNQTRNKIATHNQTLKVNKNAPTLHQHQHQHRHSDAGLATQEKKRPRTSVFQRNRDSAPKRQRTNDAALGWKDSMCDW